MSAHDESVGILMVDDNPANLVTLEATLAGLGYGLLRATSGREALRCLLRQEVALILLDVNMPGMDGFETASLIRQRKTFAQTPIIFVTANGDELFRARGYALGAVDYLLTPFTPEVLRAKVGVFVDLFRKTQQVRRQAASLQERATQLHRLTGAFLAVSAADSLEDILQVACRRAAEVLGAERAAITISVGAAWVRSRHFTAGRDGTVPLGEDPHGLTTTVKELRRAVRMSAAELEGLPPEGGRAMRGWMGAPLVARAGSWLGLVQIADRAHGDFTQEDEAVLAQLAQMVSLVIENTIYARERELSRAKDEFLATVSHELRTPLNAILGWSQLLRSAVVSGERLQHGLAVIERNARAQSSLIEDLLDASRMTSGKLQLERKRVRFRPLVDAVIDGCRPQAAGKDIALVVEHDAPEETGVFGDPERLSQVVRNLMSNAIKFTGEGGRIRISTEVVGGKLRLVVSDNGCGIDPTFLPFVFDRFRQADSTSTRSHGGLGLGLTIVRHIVELHGGSVAADSLGIGAGATLTVELPALVVGHDAIAAEHASAAAPGSGTELGSLDVLLVEDEADTREVVTQVLVAHGASVRAVASAPAALEALDASIPDLLISDLALPGQDGFALLRSIRLLPVARGGRVPAVALTAYAREEDRARVLAAGFCRHIKKPVDSAELVATLVGCLPEVGVARVPRVIAAPDSEPSSAAI